MIGRICSISVAYTNHFDNAGMGYLTTMKIARHLTDDWFDPAQLKVHTSKLLPMKDLI